MKKKKQRITRREYKFVIAIFIINIMILFLCIYYIEQLLNYKELMDMEHCRPICEYLLKGNYISLEPHSYTKGFNAICDYLIQCDGHNLVNTTLMNCYLTERNYSGWCR